MIISDTDNHKIDAVFNKDDFLQITTFHKKGDEWVTKIIGISPETQQKLVTMIGSHVYKPKENQG